MGTFTLPILLSELQNALSNSPPPIESHAFATNDTILF